MDSGPIALRCPGMTNRLSIRVLFSNSITRTQVLVLATRFVRGLPFVCSLFDEEGAGRPGARCTRSPERRKASGPVRSFQAPGGPAPFQCTGQVPQVQPGQPASLRSGVTTYFVLSPVIWLPCHRRLHKGLPLRPGSTPYAGARTTRLGRLL
jgi:hypothetical protein